MRELWDCTGGRFPHAQTVRLPHRPVTVILDQCPAPDQATAQLGVRADDGSVISFPYLSHPRAGLSHAEWRALGPGEKLERLFGMSLDDLYEIMSWPIGELDPVRLSVRMQVIRVVFVVGAKAHLDGTLGREAARGRERDRVLAEMAQDLRARPSP